MNILRWVGTSAICTGKSHFSSGTVCQDYAQVCFDRLPIIAAVADGLGSSSHSSEGARIAVDSTIKLMRKKFKEFISLDPEQIKNQIIDEIVLKIKKEAEINQLTVKDYATTIMFVATDGVVFMSGSLGDGVVSYKKLNEISKPLFTPIKGEFVNETISIASKNVFKYMQFKIGYLNNIEGFALFTDGAAESLYQKQKNYIAPAIDAILSWFNENEIDEIQNALEKNLKNIIANETYDDCSIALIKSVDIGNIEFKNSKMLKYLLSIKSNNAVHIFYRLSAIQKFLNENIENDNNLIKNHKKNKTTYKKHLKWINDNIIISNR